MFRQFMHHSTNYFTTKHLVILENTYVWANGKGQDSGVQNLGTTGKMLKLTLPQKIPKKYNSNKQI